MITMCLDGGSLTRTSWNDLCMQQQTNRTVWSNQIIFNSKTNKQNENKNQNIFFSFKCVCACVYVCVWSIGINVSTVHKKDKLWSAFVCIIFPHFVLENLLELLFNYLIVLICFILCANVRLWQTKWFWIKELLVIFVDYLLLCYSHNTHI